VKKSILTISLAAFLSFGAAISSADQITLHNGDILNGKVLAMTTNTLVLQDDSLGTLTLPRARVSIIMFGTTAPTLPPLAMPFTNVVQASPEPAARANSPSDLQAMFQNIHEHSNLVQEVEVKVLGSSASPDAVNKFNELLDGLSSGQLDMNGLRSQAQSAAAQLQDYKKQMGSEAGEEIDGYLYILNNFLRETAPTNSETP
jgi:hypothetical protein